MQKERNSQRVWGFLFIVFFLSCFCDSCNRFRVLESNCSFSIGQLSDSPLSVSSVRLRPRARARARVCVWHVWHRAATVCVVRTTKWKSKWKWKSRFNKYQLGLGLFAKTFARPVAKLCLALPLPLPLAMAMAWSWARAWAWTWAWAWLWHSRLCYVGVANYCQLLKCNSHTLQWLAWPRGTVAV